MENTVPVINIQAQKTVNVLGTKYTIEVHKRSEDKLMQDINCDGYCSADNHKIVVADMTEKKSFSYFDESEAHEYFKKTLRHEIIHAFLNESGLRERTSGLEIAWAKNEEMVDWMAIQMPKIYKAFWSANAL